MGRTYEYRVHIKKMRDIMPLILVSVALFQMITIILLADFSIMAIVFTGAFAMVLIGEAVVLRIFFNRFTKVSCSLTENGLVYKNIKKTIIIPYEDISEIEFPSIKYMGGWVKIKSSQETVRLTVVIESIQDFIMELKKELDNRELTPKMKDKSFREFVKTSTYSDHSWQRVYEVWFKQLLTIIFTTILSVVIYNVGNLVSPDVFFLAVFGYIWPVIVYLACEIVLMKWMSKQYKTKEEDSDDLVVQRDIAYDKAVYRKGIILGSVAYVLVMLLFILSNTSL